MAKPKHRQLLKANNNTTSSGPESDLLGEDSWVIVKKQKVTILIPPLPVTKQCAMPNPEENGPQSPKPRARKTIDRQSNSPIFTDSPVHPHLEIEKFMPLATEKTIPSAPKVTSSSPITTSSNHLPRVDYTKISRDPQDNSKCRRILGVCDASKSRKGCRSFRSYLNGDVVLNPKMRALNLERKLQRAGGLSSWLVSLGLDQFVKIFQSKRVGKFQLVNLSMKKLKDMGADAVGPRRKLMHALDCLCQPYCFEVT